MDLSFYHKANLSGRYLTLLISSFAQFLENEVSVLTRALGTSSVYQSFSLSVSLTMTAKRHDRLLSFLDNIPYSHRPRY